MNAVRLDAWLVDYCRAKGLAGVPTRMIQQYGTGTTRERLALEPAVTELDDLGRALGAGRTAQGGTGKPRAARRERPMTLAALIRKNALPNVLLLHLLLNRVKRRHL